MQTPLHMSLCWCLYKKTICCHTCFYTYRHVRVQLCWLSSTSTADTQLLLRTITAGWVKSSALANREDFRYRTPSLYKVSRLLDNLTVNFIPCLLFGGLRSGVEILPVMGDTAID